MQLDAAGEKIAIVGEDVRDGANRLEEVPDAWATLKADVGDYWRASKAVRSGSLRDTRNVGFSAEAAAATEGVIRAYR